MGSGPTLQDDNTISHHTHRRLTAASSRPSPDSAVIKHVWDAATAIHQQAALHGPAVPVLSPGLAGHHSTILETLANLPENAFNEAANGGHTFAIKSERF